MSIITVTNTADNGNGSLRGAIANAKSGDTIQFDKGLAGKTIALTSGQLSLNEDLTIDGSSASGLTISGNNASRVFRLEKKYRATLKNLTIANGKTMGAGGGIDTQHESTLVLENVNVNNNVSELGGGLRVGHLAKATILNSSFSGNDGTLTNNYSGFSAGAIAHNESRGQLIIKGSRFENNIGSIGGAIYSFSGVTFVVEDSVFRGNVAKDGSGGAIFTDGVSSKGYDSGLADDGKIIIRRSRFENNQAKKEGGALFLWGYTQDQGYKQDQAIIEDTVIVGNVVTADASGQAKGGGLWAKIGLDVRNVTFANNTAEQQGGGLWVESALPTNIVNSTFSGNRVLGDAGGAMFLNNGSVPVNITNSTIAYNQAGRANGGLWFDGGHNVTLKNSIVAFNTAKGDHRQDQVGYQPNDGGGNLEFATSSEAMRVFQNGLVANPLLEPLSSVNGALIHPLESGSPAVNAGVFAGAPQTDQRGIQRDSQTDIGAFELNALTPAALTPAALTQGALTPPPLTVVSPVTSPSFSFSKNKQPAVSLSMNDGRWMPLDSLVGDRNHANTLTANAASIKDTEQRVVGLGDQVDTITLTNASINLDRQSTEKISDDKRPQVDRVLEGGREAIPDDFYSYLNGEPFGTDVGTQRWGHASSIGIGGINGGKRFHDGIAPNSSGGFAGALDEAMIFNDALSSSEIGRVHL